MQLSACFAAVTVCIDRYGRKSLETKLQTEY